GAATASRSSTARARRSRRSSAPGRSGTRRRPSSVSAAAACRCRCSSTSRALRDLGEFDAASEALLACRELDAATEPPAIQPEHVLACNGELELRRGNLAAALRCFEEARDLDPESSYVWERIGRVHELRGDHAAAERAYRHAAALPRGAFALFALGRFHTNVTRNFPAAATALVEALDRLRSAEPLVRLELARLHVACGRPAAAFLQVERALACRRGGAFPEALRLAAALAEQLGRPAEAVGSLRELAALEPQDATLLERARALEAATPRGAPPRDPPLPPALAVLARAELSTPGGERIAGVVDRFLPEKG